MRICTITCHNALNHGARLQACALLHYLNTKGYEAEVIDYRPDYMSSREQIWYWPGCSVREWAKFFLRFGQRKNAVLRDSAFEKFSQKYIPRTRHIYNTIDELQAQPPQADAYMAGSDQIWNISLHNGSDPAYYLDFGGPKTKRISYAASFALPSLLPDCESFVKEHLSTFDSISVREMSGLQILSSLGFDGQVVVDPVFLLTAEAWDALLDCQDIAEPYVLVYDVVGCNTIKHIAKRFAKACRCKIYAIGSRRLGYADKNFLQAAPDKFVELIRNSRCVISNSFHATAFAIIYHRDFHVIDRMDGLNERMHDLLIRFGLQFRLANTKITDTQLIAPISYEMVQYTLQQHISESELFLTNVLPQ